MSETKKRGDIGICPNCGAPYQPGIGKCPECGHVFQNVKANSSAQLLAKKLEELIGKYKYADTDEKKEACHLEISNCIMSFVIPSDKEDLIDFITNLDSGRRSSVPWAKAYHAKYKECILKAQVLFVDDPQMTQLTSLTQKMTLFGHLKMWWNSINKFNFGVIVFFIILCSLFFGFPIYNKIKERAQEEIIQNQISEQLTKLSDAISALPVPTKDNNSDCANKIQKIIWVPVDITGHSEFEIYQRKAVKAFADIKNSYIKQINDTGIRPPLEEDDVYNHY